jgi:RND family efflux transporter MFP subunit
VGPTTVNRLSEPREPGLEGPRAELSRLEIRRDARPHRTGKIVPWVLAILALTALAAGWALKDRFLARPETVEVGLVVRTGGNSEKAVLTANGYVTARRQAGVTAKVTGRIKTLHKDLGDRVKEGELLAELECADVLAAVAEVKATLWVQRLDEERQKKLGLEGIGVAAEYDLTVARARETTARLENLQEQLENTRVKAPFDGVITVKNVEVGETVSLFGAQTSRKSGPIFVIADFGEFEVEADVNEANIAKITQGQSAEVALDAVPSRRYKGRLRQIVPTADRQKATIQVKVTILDPDAKVYPEMSAKVTFVTGEAVSDPARVVAPASGIIERGGRKVAFLLEGDRVSEVPVEAGPAAGGRVQVMSGLAGGESIVVSPPPGLVHGARVRAKDAP